MPASHSFEIQIALLGNVSAGKTTVLNALFRDQYGEVSMKRTTAGVNYFCIAGSRGEKADEAKEGKKSSDDSSPERSTWTDAIAEIDSTSSVDDRSTTASPRSAASIFHEIAADNAKLRNSDQVEEKRFDIELSGEDIVDMRPDTKLVVVDVPGLNEAGASSKYKDYVRDKWCTFDCAVVVMDGRQGVNTEEQVDLLNFVATNVKDQKDMPLIVLFNKVDDPDDEEQKELVREADQEVGRILAAVANQLHFIPISAVHAFIHQSASLMSFEEFQKFDKDLIERLGRDQIGKRAWKKMSQKERYQEVFELVKDPTENQEGLAEANFDKFLAALTKCCGGKEVQLEQIRNQLQMALAAVESAECIALDIARIHEKAVALDAPLAGAFESTALKQQFWQCYQKREDAAFQKFDRPGMVRALAEPMKQLAAYYGWVTKNDWRSEQDIIVSRMKELVQRQLGVLFDKETVSDTSAWRHARMAADDFSATWNVLSPSDWEDILSSVTFLSYDKHFCENFSVEKLAVDKLVRRASRADVPINAIMQCECGILTRLSCECCGQQEGPSGGISTCSRDGDTYTFSSGGTCGECNVAYTAVPPMVECECGVAERRNFCGGTGGNGPGGEHCSVCGRYLPASVACNSDCNKCKAKFKTLSMQQTSAGLKRKYANGRFEPVAATACMNINHIQVPSSLSDPDHFGHLAWSFCQFLASLPASNTSN